VHTHRGILRMLQARAADILMPDVQRMGGPTEFLKAGDCARLSTRRSRRISSRK
jgi:L-alanine-DL-glutamate epimerase-like enolase superfamily enzyme